MSHPAVFGAAGEAAAASVNGATAEYNGAAAEYNAPDAAAAGAAAASTGAAAADIGAAAAGTGVAATTPTDATCVSISPAANDYWCQTICVTPTNCPPTMCKCEESVALPSPSPAAVPAPR